MNKVEHPSHYNKEKIETIDLIKLTVNDYESFVIGNTIKYIKRHKFKDGFDDLEKAKFYITDLEKEMYPDKYAEKYGKEITSENS